MSVGRLYGAEMSFSALLNNSSCGRHGRLPSMIQESMRFDVQSFIQYIAAAAITAYSHSANNISQPDTIAATSHAET